MIFNKQIIIDSRVIDENSPVFIIAEAGVNHNGNMALAKELIDVACEAKADAVKFQTFHTDQLILPDVAKAKYQSDTTSFNETQFEMLKKLELNFKQFMELSLYCKAKGIIFLTTPFDILSLNEIIELNVPIIKIASSDITNIQFLISIAKKEKPIFLSSGMCYYTEVIDALKTIYKFNKNVILLQCTANYPINNNEANLNVIDYYNNNFDILIGFSDHTAGIGASPYAVAKGARVIEKHFTLDKKHDGPDHLASLTPNELTELVKQIRLVEDYLGDAIKKPTISEINTRKSLQKCFVASRNIVQGEKFDEDNIIAKRTGGKGIPANFYYSLLDKRASKMYLKNDIIDE